MRDFAKKHPECRRRRSAMLSRQFFAENLSIFQGNEAVANNNSPMDQDRMRDRGSTSTAISYLSADDQTPTDYTTDSTHMLRHRLNFEQEFDFGIPGAYR